MADQKLWLIEKFKIFKEHQDRKTTNMFFPPLYEEYFALWPPTATAENIQGAKGDEAIALARVRKTVERVRDFDFAK